MGFECISQVTPGLLEFFFLLMVYMCVKNKDGYLYLYVCFGFVEQAQGGVAVAVWSQGYEGLQPLQTQPQVSSSAKGREKRDDQSVYNRVRLRPGQQNVKCVAHW